MHTCGTCRHWRYDVNDPQDRGMESEGMRPCALETTPEKRATFLHSTIQACDKYQVVTVQSIKESSLKKIDGLYAAIGKERK